MQMIKHFAYSQPKPPSLIKKAHCQDHKAVASLIIIMHLFTIVIFLAGILWAVKENGSTL